MINYFYIWITPTVKFVLTHKLVYSYKTTLELKLHSRKKTTEKRSTNNNKNTYKFNYLPSISIVFIVSKYQIIYNDIYNY